MFVFQEGLSLEEKRDGKERRDRLLFPLYSKHKEEGRKQGMAGGRDLLVLSLVSFFSFLSTGLPSRLQTEGMATTHPPVLFLSHKGYEACWQEGCHSCHSQLLQPCHIHAFRTSSHYYYLAIMGNN